jgi:hypothetical protein
MKLNRGLAALLVIALTTLTACGGKNENGSGSGDAARKVTLEQRYGVAPVKQPKDMTYQPDVVIIGDGPKAIRHASSDGLTWTLDKKAEGVSDLQPGKVMYASSMALGRVAEVTPAGDDVDVLLAPVQLTDLIKDGTLNFDEALNLDQDLVQEVPDLPGASTVPPADPQPADPTGGGSAAHGPIPRAASAPVREINVVAPELGRSRAQLPAGLQPPPGLIPPDSTKYKVTVSDWDFEYYKRSNSKQHEIGLRVTAPLGKTIKGGFTLRMGFENLRAKAQVPIADGRVQNANVSLNGLKQIAADLSVASPRGLSDNTRLRVEVPINIPLSGAAAFGLQPSLKFKVLFKFGFSSKNTTATGTIAYTIGGDIGTGLSPTATPTASNPAESFQALSVAPFGLVIAFEVKIMLGIGLPMMSAGPYVKLVLSIGYANAGQLGAVPCRLLTVNFSANFGVGVNVSTTVGQVLGKIYGPANSSLLSSIFNSGKSAKGEVEQQLGETVDLGKGGPYAVPNSTYCRAQAG